MVTLERGDNMLEKEFWKILEQEVECVDGLEEYDPKKPSRLLVISNKGVGCILDSVGYGWEWWFNTSGSLNLEDNGLLAPDGVSIWEGDVDYYDDDCELVGEFRALTEEEWKLVSQGEDPWDEKDWLKNE